MPWKGERDPYKIWLSEIILQQTRVDQGLAYYQRFIQTFPDITALANAPDTKVFKLWEGLGYYSRCRNLLFTARYIASQKAGKFPDNYEDIKALKGIGVYTAAAISSFAFNMPYAVVDGNVFRVLARVFGIETPVDSTAGKKLFSALAAELLDKKSPALYNQAIMDFGATVCKPALPLCSECIFQKTCVAFKENKINKLPVKEKKISIRKRWFYYLVLEHRHTTAVRQRTARDIWSQLYEFPLIEADKDRDIKLIIKQAENEGLLQPGKYELQDISSVFKQTLSHQQIFGRFITIRLLQKSKTDSIGLWLGQEQLKEYAFPKLINQYLQRK